MSPRLHQPLFSGPLTPARLDNGLYNAVRAYDCIWSLLYEPLDMTAENRQHNARANLQVLGDIIERELGADCFQVDPRQLTFDEDILNNSPITGNNTGEE